MPRNDTPSRSTAETPSRRLLSREAAAIYLSCSIDQIDRLIHTGRLPVVRLPVERNRTNWRGHTGVNRRILLDVQDLNRIVDDNKHRFD